jgi:general secretion pathway protein K
MPQPIADRVPTSLHEAEAGACCRQHKAERDSGFAILAVVIVLSLLAIVAILLQKSVTTDIRLTSHLVQHTKAEALADGITRLAIRHLVVNPPSTGRSGAFHLDGIPLTCRTGSSVASITFINTDGQINLNQASQALLERILNGIGLAPAEATQMAQEIIDFRTFGDQSINGGSKHEAYRQAGLPLGPKNGPFQTVGELGQVMGMTGPLLKRLRPLMTVNSHSGVINPSIMIGPVALALAGSTAVASQDLDILRTRLSLSNEITNIVRTRSSGSTVSISNTYLIRVTVAQDGKDRFTREAVIQLTGNDTGMTVIQWTELDRNQYGINPPATGDTPSCAGGLLSLDPA